MIRNFLILLAVIFSAGYSCSAQGMYKINLNASNRKASINSVEIVVGNTNICVSIRGKILINPYIINENLDANSGHDKVSPIGNMHIDYYYDGTPSAGKLKSIGDISVTYYDLYDGQDNIGRLKSIGKLLFTYYDRFDGTDNIGRLKNIGNTTITYYDKFDGFDNIGKLKTIGDTKITYYDRFDISEPIGTIKSIEGNTPNLNIHRFQELDADND